MHSSNISATEEDRQQSRDYLINVIREMDTKYDLPVWKFTKIFDDRIHVIYLLGSKHISLINLLEKFKKPLQQIFSDVEVIGVEVLLGNPLENGDNDKMNEYLLSNYLDPEKKYFTKKEHIQNFTLHSMDVEISDFSKKTKKEMPTIPLEILREKTGLRFPSSEREQHMTFTLMSSRNNILGCVGSSHLSGIKSQLEKNGYSMEIFHGRNFPENLQEEECEIIEYNRQYCLARIVGIDGIWVYNYFRFFEFTSRALEPYALFLAANLAIKHERNKNRKTKRIEFFFEIMKLSKYDEDYHLCLKILKTLNDSSLYYKFLEKYKIHGRNMLEQCILENDRITIVHLLGLRININDDQPSPFFTDRKPGQYTLEMALFSGGDSDNSILSLLTQHASKENIEATLEKFGHADESKLAILRNQLDVLKSNKNPHIPPDLTHNFSFAF